MKYITEKILIMLLSISMTIVAQTASAGEEPSSASYKAAQIAHTEQVMKNAQIRAIDRFKSRVSDCKSFGGRMTSADICHVDQSQLFYCNSYKTSVNGKCVASKTIQTVVNVNGLAIGQPLKPIWKERGRAAGGFRGTVPAPPAFILILIGLVGLSIVKFWRKDR